LVVAKSKDYKMGEFDFPRGWFMIAEASELGKSPLPLRFFGKDFALFRGESGRLVLLDAHCAHMGAHLAASTSASLVVHGEQIEGDAIRCPYHGWRFNHDGYADDIPGFDGPCPKAAKLGSYRVTQVMGAIMMWHDPEGGEPDFDPPSLPEWDRPDWINGAYDHLGRLDIHPQEILDNMADSNHLGPTHGAPCEYFENEFNGHLYYQRQGGFRREYDAYLMTYTWYTGPGLLLSKQAIGDIRSIEFIFHTPVDDGVTQVWHNNLLKASSDAPGEEERSRAAFLQNEVLSAFKQDFDIWRNKMPALQIMSLPTERNFRLGRSWYKQFYNPRERAGEFHATTDGKHIPIHKKPPYEMSLELEAG
jgi:3-ketosteroid 9alpha-monooxygenase subunit A